MENLLFLLLPLLLCLTIQTPAQAQPHQSPDANGEEGDPGDLDEGDLDEGDLDEGDLDDEFALLEEEDVIYSAAKHKQAISDSPSSITVITREQIENTHCTDISCLIRQVPEMELRRFRALYQNVSGRSMGITMGDKHLLLIDGREVNLEAFGLPMWMALPVHLEDVERIEVTRGPGSSLYGANAHSAVIAITTRRIDKTRQSFYLGGGELGRNWLGARSAWKLDSTGLEIIASVDRENNWEQPERTERDVMRARLRLEHDWGEAGRTDFHTGVSLLTGVIHSALAPLEMSDTLMTHGRLAHETEHWRGQVWFSMFKGDMHFKLPLYFGDVKLGTFPEAVDMMSTNLDADLQFNWPLWKGNLFIAGANYRWLTYMSKLNDPQNTHQHRVGLLVQDEQRLWDQLLVTAGARLDYNTISPFTVSPRAALVWRFLPDQILRMSGGMAFRKPSFFNTSIHITGVEGEPAFPNLGEFFRRSIGNDKLDNESVSSVELGYRGQFLDGSLTVELLTYLAFYRGTANFDWQIEYNMLGMPDLSCPADPSEPCNSLMFFRNKGWETNTAGGYLSIDWRPVQQVRILGNYTQRYTWFVNRTPQKSEITGDKVGDRFRYESQHLANLSVHYLSLFGLRVGLSAFVRSSHINTQIPDGSLFGTEEVIRNPANWLLGGYLSWRLGSDERWLETGIKVFDILNTSYRDATSTTRFDGELMGGMLMSRRAVLFVRGQY